MKQLITKALGTFINVLAVFFPTWSTAFSFNLFCKVQAVGYSKKGKQFMDKATSTFLDVDGHSAVLHSWGNGSKKILFLHGWMSHSQRWQTYIERLDLKQYTVYAIDAPGHGMSKGNHLNIEIYRKAIVQAIEKAGAIDTLISHSLGGLVVAYSYLYNTALPIKRYAIMGTPSGMDAIFKYYKDLLGLSARAMHNLKELANSILKIPHQEIYMEHFFSKVNASVLVIHEKNDTITPFKPIKEALENHKNIKTYFTEGLKHDLKSEAVYNKVVAYIEQQSIKMEQSRSA